MIVREWDPAADGHRVGRFGPGPGVRRAAVATLFGSRPRLLDRRGELVALGGPKPFFGTLSLPFSSIAYPKLSSSSALVTPRPGIEGWPSC
jgi:hypothetical protein